MLKHSITKDQFDELPDALKEQYREKDGSYYLQVEGMVPKSKVDEFRENNIKLLREKDELVEKYKWVGDLTEEKFNELVKKATSSEGKIDQEKLDGLVSSEVEKRVSKMKKEYEEKIGGLDEIIKKQNNQLSTLVIDNEIANAAVKAGVVESAIEDIKLRARSVFRVEEGKAVPYNGDDVIYGVDGTTPMSINDWLKERQNDAPHWFKPSQGGGSQSHKNGASAGGAGDDKVRGAARMKAARES